MCKEGLRHVNNVYIQTFHSFIFLRKSFEIQPTIPFWVLIFIHFFCLSSSFSTVSPFLANDQIGNLIPGPPLMLAPLETIKYLFSKDISWILSFPSSVLV